MSLIARFMPAPSLREIDRIAVAADPGRAYRFVRDADLQQLRFVRLLFALRTLPERMTRFLRGEPPAPGGSRIDDITRAGSGFLLLAESPGKEVVIGSAGKFWLPNIEFAAVTPECFTGFDAAGYGKLAWCFRVDPRVAGGCWISVELRVGATDAEALARFRPYWRMIGRFSRAIRRGLLRRALVELGPVDPESRSIPGDEIVLRPRFQRTHATVIEAPPAEVWPWLVQMGCDRAGWYSFDWLDNGRVPSADRVIPALQQIAVGDTLPARPGHSEGFSVLQLEPRRLLVLGTPRPPTNPAPTGSELRTSWTFFLEPIGEDATQLTVRVRADFEAGMKMALLRPMIGAAHEVMERRQIHNLRRRASRPSS
jgi:hypothetical protein